MSKAIPRLDLREMPDGLAAALQPRVERLGYLGEFFRVAGHQPQALEAFVDFTESAKSDLPKALVEVIALTCAAHLGNAYERHQHERLSVRLGLGRDWVEAVERLNPDGLNPDGLGLEEETPKGTQALSEAECAVQRYLLAALESHGRSEAAHTTFEHLVELLGHRQAVAVMMVAGRYLVHALIVNTLALEPPVPSIFEDGFVG
ncbi:carboxymuconolactone decarboxylase family protein [Algihabitans albus]|uniref:carboxymuconolactone decarboxylase family protein n=1 Tax=Algihabitans albus TaxID=2164067 RepID=UPI000E5D57B7|nr:carboxymuconolactone decarboxylase family protein [Algihabitans albus]